MHDRSFGTLVWVAVILIMAVLVLSAGLRLGKAGIGCADWPACYGRIGVEGAPSEPRGLAGHLHRLVASLLALTVLALNGLAFFGGRVTRPRGIPLVLLGLTGFLAVIGVWSAGLHRPAVVLGNVLGGMTMLALAWWLALSQQPRRETPGPAGNTLRPWALLGIAVIGLQIVSGALTSAEFAALACASFPDCQGTWWPALGALEDLPLFGLLPLTTEGTVVAGPGQASLHMLHRLGTLVALAYLGWLGAKAIGAGGWLRRAGAVMLVLLASEVALGSAAVLIELPFVLAAAHNAVAALLLLAVVTLYHNKPSWRPSPTSSAR